MHRLERVNLHFSDKRSANPQSSAKPKRTSKTTDDIWQSMNLDQYLSDKVITMRKAIAKVMEESYSDILAYSERSEFPFHLIDKIR